MQQQKFYNSPAGLYFLNDDKDFHSLIEVKLTQAENHPNMQIREISTIYKVYIPHPAGYIPKI